MLQTKVPNMGGRPFAAPKMQNVKANLKSSLGSTRSFFSFNVKSTRVCIGVKVQKSKANFATSEKKVYSGIDEAGLGPLFGPLAIVRTNVAVDKNLSIQDVNSMFTQSKTGVADSKMVYGEETDMKILEAVALSGAKWLSKGKVPKTASEFFEMMGEKPSERTSEWMQGAENLKLPIAATEIKDWKLEGIEPVGYNGSIIHPYELNREKERGINKANLELSHIGKLVSENPRGFKDIHLSIDRLGGRRYYAQPLQSMMPESVVKTIEEGGKLCQYSCTNQDQHIFVEFVVAAEDYSSVVALSSCLAKYTRELHMTLFNNYWSGKFPKVSPTNGYWMDAVRWMRQLVKHYPNGRDVFMENKDTLLRKGSGKEDMILKRKVVPEGEEEKVEQK